MARWDGMSLAVPEMKYENGNGSEEMPRVTRQGRLGETHLVVFGCIPMRVSTFFYTPLMECP